MRYTFATGTTNGSGAATVDTDPINGEVIAVVVDGEALTDGADLTLQPTLNTLAGAVELGESIINNGDVGNATLSTFYPRRFAQAADGTDITVATSTKAIVPFVVPGTALRATIANGGDTKAFGIWVIWRDA